MMTKSWQVVKPVRNGGGGGLSRHNFDKEPEVELATRARDAAKVASVHFAINR